MAVPIAVLVASGSEMTAGEPTPVEVGAAGSRLPEQAGNLARRAHLPTGRARLVARARTLSPVSEGTFVCIEGIVPRVLSNLPEM